MLLLPYFLILVLFVGLPTLLIIIKSLSPTSAGPMNLNWSFINDFIWMKILQSFLIAIITTFICILISYPFAYFLSFSIRSKAFKTLIVLLITAPIWMSFLIKIVGLKTFFDCINGFQNSTYGNIWTIIGLIYVYLPFMVLPIYNTLQDMPKNLIFASKDLGRNNFSTFIHVVLPYTKAALMSGVTLVFLPAITTVAVPQFMNASTSGSMIGDIIMEEGSLAQTSDISLARASALSLLIALLILMVFVIYLIIKLVTRKIKKKMEAKYV